MAQMFTNEKRYSDNSPRMNFIFLGYPFVPPLPLDDYRAATAILQEEYPIRLWYFLDEITTDELMRKVWRAILRSDLSVFDISGGNPNVAFELGLAVAGERRCATLLKTGEPNPLGTADLGYSERSEYSSRETLVDTMRELLKSKSSALRNLNTLSYELISDAFPFDRAELEARLLSVVNLVFRNKRTTRAGVRKVFDNDDYLAGTVLAGLRQYSVLQPEGARRHARWVFSSNWVYHDHEVTGE